MQYGLLAAPLLNPRHLGKFIMSDSLVCAPADLDIDPRTLVNFNDRVAWAIDKLAQGHCAAQVFNVLRDGGWSVDDAAAVLLDALPHELRDQVSALSSGAPDPDLGNSPSAITIDGHTVRVLCELRDPRVVVFGNLVTPAECDELIAAASPRLERSLIRGEGGQPEVDNRRTSSGMRFQRDEILLCARLEARIAALLNWPILHSEELQVLHYLKGQEIRLHHDHAVSEDGMWSPVFRRGGRRVATLVVYLNTPPLGGSTVFPDIPLEVRPVTGNALFFSYATPEALGRTWHRGAPVGDGEKWIAMKVFRQGVFA